jgi:hypothetical protein
MLKSQPSIVKRPKATVSLFHNEEVPRSARMLKPQLLAVKSPKVRVTTFRNKKVPRSTRMTKPQPLTIMHSKVRVTLFLNKKLQSHYHTQLLVIIFSSIINCYHHTSNTKPQPQCTRATFWDNLANYYHRLNSSGLNLAYEGLLLEAESKASWQSHKIAKSSQSSLLHHEKNGPTVTC